MRSSTLMGLHISISLKAYLYQMPSNQQPTSWLLHKDFWKRLLNYFLSQATYQQQNKERPVFFSFKIISFSTTYRQIPQKEIKPKKKTTIFPYSLLRKFTFDSYRYIQRYVLSHERI